jgi:hypothetical protein
VPPLMPPTRSTSTPREGSDMRWTRDDLDEGERVLSQPVQPTKDSDFRYCFSTTVQWPYFM